MLGRLLCHFHFHQFEMRRNRVSLWEECRRCKMRGWSGRRLRPEVPR